MRAGQHRLDGSKQYRLVGSGRQKGVYMTDVYVISGFLGAGKTTLIKTMVHSAFKNKKLVVIENDVTTCLLNNVKTARTS